MTNQTENTKPPINKQNTIPLLIRLFGTIVLVISIIVAIFFSATSIYQLYNPQFFDPIINNSHSYDNIVRYVFVVAILNLGIIISTIFVFKFSIYALYSTIIIILLMIINELFFNNSWSYLYLSIYISFGILLIMYRKIFINKLNSNQ